MADTAARLLRLLALLQSQPRWAGPALADRLGVSVRTVRADIERLRSLDYTIDATPGADGGYRLRAGTRLPPVPLDYTIDATPGADGGYRLRAGTRLPPVPLDDDEAVAVAVALRTATTSGLAGIGEHATRAAAKLEQLLPARLRPRLTTVDRVTETAPTTRDPVAPHVFAAVTTAIERCEQLRFDYLDRHHDPSRRRIEPHRLVHVSGRWYLVGYDLDRDDWRSYRVDRITPTTPTGPRFLPRQLPGPDLATFVTRGRMAAMWNYRARITIDAPAETVTARIPTGIWTVERLDPHTSTLDAGAQTPQLLAAYLGALDLNFHIDPDQAPELAAAVATLAARYAAATH